MKTLMTEKKNVLNGIKSDRKLKKKNSEFVDIAIDTIQIKHREKKKF